MLGRHRDRAAVIGGDLVQVRDTLGERGTIGHGRVRAVAGQGQYGHGPARGGQHVHALVPVLQRKVDPRPRRDAPSSALEIYDPEWFVRQQLIGPCHAAPFNPRVFRPVVQPARELAEYCQVCLIGSEHRHRPPARSRLGRVHARAVAGRED